MLARLSGSLAPLSFLLLLSLLLSATTPNFASRDNLKQIAIQAAVVAILACGQTAVIVAGHIDLSVGAMMALSGVVAGQSMHLYHVNMWVAVLAACVTGAIVGVLNGMITAYGKISAFIVTLGMMGLAYGVGSILAHSQNVFGFSPGFDVFGNGELFGGKKNRFGASTGSARKELDVVGGDDKRRQCNRQAYGKKGGNAPERRPRKGYVLQRAAPWREKRGDRYWIHCSG